MNTNRKLTICAMMLALGLLLPFATAHGIGIPGNIFLPMHIPVFICAFLCGPLLGGLCGFLLPILNCILTGMPSLYPTMPLMTLELLTYGISAGVLYTKTPLLKMKLGIYPALVISMICGRAVYGVGFRVLLAISSELKAQTVWASIATGLPGIVVQLLLVPAVIFAVKRYNKNRCGAMNSAINLIREDRVSCVIIRDGTIVRTECGRGIAPIIKLYREGALKGAFVVDKIIGKAAAMIMVLGGVGGCYGVTVSRGAESYLKARGITVRASEFTEKIINRAGDGICPMEMAVENIDDGYEALDVLERRIKELQAEGAKE